MASLGPTCASPAAVTLATAEELDDHRRNEFWDAIRALVRGWRVPVSPGTHLY